MDALREKSIVYALMAGALLTLVGAVVSWTFMLAGGFHAVATRDPLTGAIRDKGDLNLLPFSFAVFAIGVLTLLGAVGYGLYRGGSRANRGVRTVVANARVLARYGYSRDGQMLTAEWEIEAADRVRLYVRMQSPNGQVVEYECSPEVYFQSGEGMVGEAQIEGRWLGNFVPYIGIATS